MSASQPKAVSKRCRSDRTLHSGNSGGSPPSAENASLGKAANRSYSERGMGEFRSFQRVSFVVSLFASLIGARFQAMP